MSALDNLPDCGRLLWTAQYRYVHVHWVRIAHEVGNYLSLLQCCIGSALDITICRVGLKLL